MICACFAYGVEHQALIRGERHSGPLRAYGRDTAGTMALEEADSRPSLACVLRLVLMAYWLPWLSLTHLVHPCITLLTSVSGSLGRLGIPAPRKWLSSKDGFAAFSICPAALKGDR